MGRVQVSGPDDIPAVKKIQQGFLLCTYSSYIAGHPMPPMASTPQFPAFDEEKLLTLNFFEYANQAMQHITIHPSERELFETFSKIGIAPGLPFPPAYLGRDICDTIQAGITDCDNLMKMAITIPRGQSQEQWSVIVHPRPFGTRSEMQGRYKIRAIAAMVGLYGLGPEEAFYPRTTKDTTGEPLDGEKFNYVIRFDGDRFPDVNGFWSITMYNDKMLLVNNEIKRYSIGSQTPGLEYDKTDGSLTLYIQHRRPKNISNWLPAPNGLFSLTMRIFWPTEATYNGSYHPPGVANVGRAWQKSSV